MGLTTRRDDAVLAEGLRRWLADRRGLDNPVVTGLDRPSAGYSSETLVVGLSSSEGGNRSPSSLVVRLPPPVAGTFREYDLTAQWQAQMAARAVGVPIADPVLEADPVWLGAPFLVMPLVQGHIVGAVPHLDPWLAGRSGPDQAGLYRSVLAVLARIHRAEVSAAEAVPRHDNGAELDFWDDYLGWSSGGSPVEALAEALRWCRRNRPRSEPEATLLWGDARFENMVFGDDLDVLAVLDWDMSTVGAPEHDLAWFTSIDTTVLHLFGTRVSGFPSRDEAIELFEGFEGRAVRDIEWYETLALLRSTAVMTRIGYLCLEAGAPPILPIEDNPILDLLLERLR